MKKVYLILAATVGMTITSCTTNDFVGEVATTPEEVVNDGSIRFGGGFKAVTRADHVGADAATLLGGKFIVSGFKGASTQATTGVFNDYLVTWSANSAGKTASNTDDWEYVDNTSPVASTGLQTIKYWDYSQALYDFIAYSPGSNDVTVKTTSSIDATDPSSDEVFATPIDAANVTTAAYLIKGGESELTKCYIADRVTVEKANYNKVVSLTFRALAAKVRFGLYETVPGYSVKDVEFYQDNSTLINASVSGNPATLIGTFNTGGKYTVYYNDGQKAHVTLTNDGYTPATYRGFGSLTYGADPVRNEVGAAGSYLQRSANTPSYANGGTYVTVLPVETASNVIELRVNYTLEAIDNGEIIKVHGAKAYVPANYTQWLPNYAYTYIFKISDNTNGWTSTSESDPAGLFPITFDAVVTDSEELKQSTITTVASPSITAYQNGRSLDADEFANGDGDIYIQVMNNGTLATDLNSKSSLYTLNRLASEAEVLDALHIQTTGSATVNGRNGLELTEETITSGFTSIPRADGNNMTVVENSAAKFSASGAGNYVYVYATGTWNGVAHALTAEPTDWNASNNVYYTDAACTTQKNTSYVNGTYYKKVSYIYTAEETSGSAPSDWTDDGVWYKDPNGETPMAAVAWVAGTYYKRYTVDHQIYGVKVIKVQ